MSELGPAKGRPVVDQFIETADGSRGTIKIDPNLPPVSPETIEMIKASPNLTASSREALLQITDQINQGWRRRHEGT